MGQVIRTEENGWKTVVGRDGSIVDVKFELIKKEVGYELDAICFGGEDKGWSIEIEEEDEEFVNKWAKYTEESWIWDR